MKVLGIAVSFIFIITAITAGSLAYRYYMAPVHGKVNAEVQIESAPSRIQKYEHFFNLCAQVQTMKASIAAQRDLLDPAETTKERSRIRANLAGMTAQLARYVNQYNADSQKNYTKARFKDSSLPYTLSVDGKTFCQ